VDPDDLEGFARAAATLADLEIDEAWWPAVVRHLDVLVERASEVASFDTGATGDSAAVFRP
jgi:hypothetical protein